MLGARRTRPLTAPRPSRSSACATRHCWPNASSPRSTRTTAMLPANWSIAGNWRCANLAAALPAPDDALEQCRALTGRTARHLPLVLGVVIAQHRLDPLEALPVDVSRVPVLDNDLPLRHRTPRCNQPAIGIERVARPGPAIDKSAGICRVS